MLEKTEKLINICQRNPNAETQVTLSNRHRTKQDTLNRKIYDQQHETQIKPMLIFEEGGSI